MIKVYTTPTCPWCKKTKKYLDSKGIQYKNIDVVEDENGRNEMVKLTGQRGVPVINIDGNIILGFDKDAIDDALTRN